MTLIKWNSPSRAQERRNLWSPFINNQLNDLFFDEDFFSREFAGYVPAVNIIENEKKYSIEVSAPGFDKQDFKIEVEKGVLKISGEHKTDKKEEESNFTRREFNYGSFSRSFNISESIDEEKIDAKYENGILKLHLPKKEQVKNSKEIKIS